MSARKFIAATSREALKMVKQALGDEAVILSNRKVPEGVEIVAMGSADLSRLSEMRAAESKAVPPAPISAPQLNPQALNQAAILGAKVLRANTQRAAAAAIKVSAPQAPLAPVSEPSPSPATEQAGILNEIKNMRNMLQEQMSCMAWGDLQQRNPQRSALLRDMINVGFSPALSKQLLDKMPADGNQAWVQRILGHNLRAVSAKDDIVTRGGVYALVGPTGVGKTTTTAKLAARAVVRYGADKVALVTTDSYRIGAHEQLKIYGQILGVAVHTVRDTEDLKLTLSGLKHKHLVLIDTMGVGQRDNRVPEQAQMFDAAGVQRILLLNATSAGGTLDDVVKMYRGTGVLGCIATKLDEAVTLGTVLDVIIRHQLNMHFIASGQRVPEDLHEVNREYLLHRAFKVTEQASAFAVQELDFPVFMANSAPLNRAGYVL